MIRETPSASPSSNTIVQSSLNPTIEMATNFQSSIIFISFDNVPGRLLSEKEGEHLEESLLNYINVYVPRWKMIINEIGIASQWSREVTTNGTSYRERLLEESSYYQLFVSVVFDAYIGPDQDLSTVVTEALSRSGDDDNSIDFVLYVKGVPALGLEEGSFFYRVDVMEFSDDPSMSPTDPPSTTPSITTSAESTLISSAAIAAIGAAAVSFILF